MSNIEEQFQVLGLTEEKRESLRRLGELSQSALVERRLVIVETVVVKDGKPEVTNRENALAKLVRTTH